MPLLPDNSLESALTCYLSLNTRVADPKTVLQYRLALANLQLAAGRVLAISDLSDDRVAGMMLMLREKNLAARTINDRRARIHAFWTWLARRGYVHTWPTTQSLAEPERIPEAWSEKQMRALFNAAACERRKIGGCPAWLWWTCLLSIAWDTGERIGAILQCDWPMVDFDGRWLTIPAESRKGKRKDMLYKLSPETISALWMLRKHGQEKILPWDRHPSYLWTAYGNLLRAAGLPSDRKSKFHRLRKSVATHYEAAGYDAQKLLGHSSRSLTEKYLDPRFLTRDHAADVLFRPNLPR